MSNHSQSQLKNAASQVVAAVLSLSLALAPASAFARTEAEPDGGEASEAIAEEYVVDDVPSTDEEAVVDAAIGEDEPLAASSPDSEPLTASPSGEWGECSWSIDSNGLLKIWPTNGTSGMLADSRGYEDDASVGFPWYDYREEVKSVSVDPGAILPSNCSCFLYDCDNLESVDASGWDTSNVTDMTLWFGECGGLKSVDASGWDTSRVTSMLGMFLSCNMLESVDTSGWDTSNVTDMAGMFGMEDSWEGEDVPESQLKTIDVSGWDVSSVVYMNRMFSNCCNLETLDVSGWDTSHVQFFSYAFDNCYELKALDVSGWDTSHAESFKNMFSGCYELKTLDVSGWDTSSATDMTMMFQGFWGEYLDVSNWDTSKIETLNYAFSGCENLTSLDVSNWDTSSATSMYAMFDSCSKLDSLDVSKWDTSGVTMMGQMFRDCSLLSSIDVSKWDISLVEDMSEMFSGCSSLASLDLSGWDNSTLQEYEFYGGGHMFDECTALSRITVGDKYDTSKAFPAATSKNEKWWSTKAGKWFTVDEIQSSRSAVPDTYTADQSTSADISVANVSPIADQIYTGMALTPTPVVTFDSTNLESGTDYTLSYKDNTAVGTATVTITGKGNYTGAKSVTFKVVPASVEKATVEAIADQAYTGAAIEPAPVVKLGSATLKSGTDYTLSYKDNTAVGTATITVTGKGNYTGTKDVAFKVVPASVEKATVEAIADQAYTGAAIEPSTTVKVGPTTLKSGTDYTLSYKNNINAGTATATVTGKGNYTGTKSVTFKIVAASVENATVSAIADQAYTGAAIEPAPVVKLGSAALKSGTDYTLSYKNNTNAGTATVTITGIGNYTGTKSVTFKVVPADIEKATVEAIADQDYTSKAIKPTPVVKMGPATLKSGTDYTLSYADNVDAGTATITVTGKGNYTGAKSVTFKIVVATQEMYRLYNPNSGEHFYTAKAAERDALVKVGWVYERVGWIAPVLSRTPVYRLYNKVAGDHHYTMNAGERAALLKIKGWVDEGIGWYSDDAQGMPLYRQYNPNAVTGSHNYTTNKKENDALVKMGWIAEDIGWYGVKQ